MFDDVIVVYKFFGDLMFYVTGSQDENELILYTVLQAFYESISLLLRCRWQSVGCSHVAPVSLAWACHYKTAVTASTK
jgi:Clathrin adaptor complex small chain